MTGNTPPLVFVDLFQAPKTLLHQLAGRPQRWRWRAINGDNHRVLAVSSEAYTNYSDCVAAIEELFGSLSDIYLRQAEQGNQLLRPARTAD